MTSLDNPLPTSSCSICLGHIQEEKLEVVGLHLDASRVVHQICSECDAFNSDTSQLCSFCSHIRPNHLFTCRCVHDLFEDNGDGALYVELGTPTELHSRRKDCTFCRWCLEVVQADARLLQHTIDENDFVRIMRRICVEKERFGPDVSAHTGWHAETILYYSSKASQLFHNAAETHWLKLGDNKRLRALPANFSETLTEPDLPELEDISLSSSVVDWAKVRHWGSTCEKEHENCHKTPIGKLPVGFRLIDVEMECMIATSLESESFFALSYVWGPQLENAISTRRDNLSVLMQPYSLRNMPWTISHAMHVCKEMGQRYLWVDRLCIVQDDRNDKYGQIGSLEAIYSRADLVIVAACGDSMRSGLAGANEEFAREQWQFPLKSFGFTLANKLHGFDLATQSTWDRRGWTYQEAVLSKRKLYFTPAEVWWECEEGHLRESSFSVGHKKDTGYLLRARDTGGTLANSDVYEDYRLHVQRYSLRILSYPSDVYHAFQGIENAFYPDGKVIHGLPEADFSRALLWHALNWLELRERRCDDQDIILPSWSWASLEGAVTTCCLYGHHGYRRRQIGSFYSSLCAWYTWDGNHGQQGSRGIHSINDQNVWPQIDKIWSDNRKDRAYPDHLDSFRGSPDYRQVLAMAWSKGCIEARFPADLADPDTELKSPQALQSRWPTIKAFFDEVAIQRRDHHSADPCGSPRLDPGHLSTRTQWSVLSIGIEYGGIPEHLSGSVNKPIEEFIIHSEYSDKQKSAIGALLDTFEYGLRGMALVHGAAEVGFIAEVDFIALAIGAMPWRIARLVDQDILEKNCFHVSQPKDEIRTGQPGVIVMAIRWSGSVAHRLGLGWVALQGWVDSSPEFRTIVLA